MLIVKSLSQDWSCRGLMVFWRDLLTDTTFGPPHFSLDNIFTATVHFRLYHIIGVSDCTFMLFL